MFSEHMLVALPPPSVMIRSQGPRSKPQNMVLCIIELWSHTTQYFVPFGLFKLLSLRFRLNLHVIKKKAV